MVPLSFYPILGGIYAALQIVGSIPLGWALSVELIQEPDYLEAVLLVEDIAYIVAHVLLIVGILKANVKYVKAFKFYFIVFLLHLIIMIIIIKLDMPNFWFNIWFENEMVYVIFVGIPVFLLTWWIVIGVQRYVEQTSAQKTILLDEFDSNYDKQNLV